jgi:hypothetical protein
MAIDEESVRWYDPRRGPGQPITIELTRVPEATTEEWYLETPIAYRDRHFHAAGEPDFVVPRSRDDFRTDLTSVPQLFTWLVPKTGTHLPAALLHDALTPPFAGVDSAGNVLPDWVGPVHVTQLQADRIFRDAMADLGTPLLRRWMVWAAVSIPTARKVSPLRGLLGYLGLATIAILGWFATLDLFDQGEWLPWMGDRSWNRELLAGGAMAVAVPLALCVLWPPGLRKAGAITGVAIGALLHVTVMVGAVSFAYQFAEFRFRVWSAPRAALKIAATVGALAVVALTIWMCHRY